jgi:hypothetical protein
MSHAAVIKAFEEDRPEYVNAIATLKTILTKKTKLNLTDSAKLATEVYELLQGINEHKLKLETNEQILVENFAQRSRADKKAYMDTYRQNLDRLIKAANDCNELYETMNDVFTQLESTSLLTIVDDELPPNENLEPQIGEDTEPPPYLSRITQRDMGITPLTTDLDERLDMLNDQTAKMIKFLQKNAKPYLTINFTRYTSNVKERIEKCVELLGTEYAAVADMLLWGLMEAGFRFDQNNASSTGNSTNFFSNPDRVFTTHQALKDFMQNTDDVYNKAIENENEISSFTPDDFPAPTNFPTRDTQQRQHQRSQQARQRQRN